LEERDRRARDQATRSAGSFALVPLRYRRGVLQNLVGHIGDKSKEALRVPCEGSRFSSRLSALPWSAEPLVAPGLRTALELFGRRCSLLPNRRTTKHRGHAVAKEKVASASAPGDEWSSSHTGFIAGPRHSGVHRLLVLYGGSSPSPREGVETTLPRSPVSSDDTRRSDPGHVPLTGEDLFGSSPWQQHYSRLQANELSVSLAPAPSIRLSGSRLPEPQNAFSGYIRLGNEFVVCLTFDFVFLIDVEPAEPRFAKRLDDVVLPGRRIGVEPS